MPAFAPGVGVDAGGCIGVEAPGSCLSCGVVFGGFDGAGVCG